MPAGNADKFDQEWNDYAQQGETLEQYECFKEYERLLDANLSEFAEKEGYTSVGECFAELEQLVHQARKGVHRQVDGDVHWLEEVKDLPIGGGCYKGLRCCRGVNLCVTSAEIYALCGEQGVEFVKLLQDTDVLARETHRPAAARAAEEADPRAGGAAGIQQLHSGPARTD